MEAGETMRAVPPRATHGLSVITVAGCTALLAGLIAAPAAARPVARGTGQAAVPGSQLWVSRYNGPGNDGDAASSVAVSPGRGAIFVTGTSGGSDGLSDYATVAY